MDSKIKTLVWTIIALIVLNIGSLGFLWYKQVTRPGQLPPPRNQQANPDKFLEMELQLTDEQVAAFSELRQQHQQETRKIRQVIHGLSGNLVEELFKSQPDTARVAALSDEIGRKQAEYERITYSHFDELKQVCTPDQQEKLRVILFEMLDNMRMGTPPPGYQDTSDRRPPPPRIGGDRDQPPPPPPDDNPDTKPPTGG